MWLIVLAKDKRYLLQRCIRESDSRPEALYNHGSGSSLARAYDTATHYATIHCPANEQWTRGAARRHTTVPVSHTWPKPRSP